MPVDVNTWKESWTRDNSRDLFEVPAALFTNPVGKSNKFSSVYLFKQFGTSQSFNLNLKSDITTHYTEENYHINDHWAIPPDTYTLTGLIGEVIYTQPDGYVSNFLTNVRDFLAPLAVIAPEVDSYTQSAVNLGKQLEATFKKYETIAKNALSEIGFRETVDTTNQEYIIQQMKKIRDNRMLVKVYTPYGTWNDMAITSVNASQQNSRFQSTLEVTLQKWRTVGSDTRQATEDEKSKLQNMQSAITQQQGVAGYSNKSLSDSTSTLGAITGLAK